MKIILSYFFILFFSIVLHAQTIVQSKYFALASPNSEPDGRNDIVKISTTDFAVIAKTKGNKTGKSEFVLQRIGQSLQPIWEVPLSAETFEDFKDLYFNGKDLVLLSVIHDTKEKKTRLEAYGFDQNSGKKIWVKELESYLVGDWEQSNPYKGKVRERFVDIVCEHIDPDFVTPVEYQHNIQFSPDQSKFISYVYNYGEKNLTATVCLYDNACNLLKKDVVGIDNKYLNHGIYVNNQGLIYIVNSNNSGKLNLIQYDLDARDFKLIELPGSNLVKDDFHLYFINDSEVLVANTETSDDKIVGLMYSKFNFKTENIDLNVYQEFDDKFKAAVAAERKAAKHMKGQEDWRFFDITDFIMNEDESVVLVLEKRILWADGYPYIKKGVFDKSHTVLVNGHIQAEAVIMLKLDKDGMKWYEYIAKNQVYPADDGLNTISIHVEGADKDKLKLIYAHSDNTDASVHEINLIVIDKNTGKIVKNTDLPNDDKLLLVREYTFWPDENSVILVGKKGIGGKSSSIARYKVD